MSILRTSVLTAALSSALLIAPGSARRASAQDASAPPAIPLASQLALSSYPGDPEAKALILLDRGEVSIDQEWEIDIRHTRRVQLFTEEAFEWGTVRIPYRGSRKSISGLRGRTHRLTPAGTIETKELDPAQVFVEDSGRGLNWLVFTMPGLTPGCIIEYQYDVHRDNVHDFQNWSFQHAEPTLWSELVFEFPDKLEFGILQRNIVSFAVESTEGRPNLQKPGAGRTRLNWALKDVPALRPEPWVWSADDHRKSLLIQLKAVRGDKFVSRRDILPTWDALGEDLRRAPNFGGQLAPPAAWKKRARAAAREAESPLAAMTAIYDLVRTGLVWNGSRAILAGGNLETEIARKRVGGAEMALLLTGLLRDAKLNADPVLVSTLDNGRIFDSRPILQQFNHIITAVRIDDDVHLLDATDPDRPWFLLPRTLQGCEGLLIPDEGECQFLETGTGMPSDTQCTVTASVGVDGSVSGRVKLEASGHDGLELRRRLRESGDARLYAESRWLEGRPGARLDSVTVGHADSVHLPIRLEAQFHFPPSDANSASALYVEPVLFEAWRRNPLEAPLRRLPVQLPGTWRSRYDLSLELPAGYRLETIPTETSRTLPDRGGALSRTRFLSGHNLELRMEHAVWRSDFRTAEYPGLRDFLGELVTLGAEKIVLVPDASDGAAGR